MKEVEFSVLLSPRFQSRPEGFEQEVIEGTEKKLNRKSRRRRSDLISVHPCSSVVSWFPPRNPLTSRRAFSILPSMKQWVSDYIKAQKAAHDSIPVEGVARLIEKISGLLKDDRQIFVFGNGGSAANASH